jgi:hypothetical protein
LESLRRREEEGFVMRRFFSVSGKVLLVATAAVWLPILVFLEVVVVPETSEFWRSL